MIRHDNEAIQKTVRIMDRQIIPTPIDDFSERIQIKHSFFNFAKEIFSIFGADRHKVVSILAVIVILQPVWFSVSHLSTNFLTLSSNNRFRS